MTATEALRTRVVTLVLVGVLALTAGLYGLIGLLLWHRGIDTVPDALWLAAGTAAGTVFGWLNNSKGTEPGPVEVTATDPLPVTETGTGGGGFDTFTDRDLDP